MIDTLRRVMSAVIATSPARLRRDAALVLVLTATTGGLSAYSQAGSRIGDAAADAGARQAVAAAGRAADLVVEGPVGASDPTSPDPIFSPSDFLDSLPDFAAALPAVLRARIERPVGVLIAPLHDAVPADGRPALSVRLAAVDDRTAAELHAEEPATAGTGGEDRIDVVLPASAAARAGLHTGSELVLTPAEGAAAAGDLRVRVIGTLAVPAWATEALDADLPDLADGTRMQELGGDGGLAVTALTTPAGALRAAAVLGDRWSGTARLRFDASRFDAAAVPAVEAAIDRGFTGGVPLPAGRSFVLLRSGFGTALGGFPAEVAAARSLQRIALVGALMVGLLTVGLLSAALGAARSQALTLERVRGITAAQVLLRSMAEAVPLTLMAAAVGVAAAAVVVPGAATVGPILPVVLAAALTPPVMELLQATRLRIGGAQLVVLDAVAVVVAATAVVALEQGTDVDDPLLAAAPALIALGASVLVRRLAVLGAAVSGRVLRHGRGATAALAAGRRTAGGAVLVAVAVATAGAVTGALLLAGLDAGQRTAAIRAVGGDVRVTGATTARTAERVSARPGVEAAAAVRVDGGSSLVNDDYDSSITLVGVDADYERVLRSLHIGSGAGLQRLRSAAGSNALPVFVDPALEARFRGTARLEVDGREIPVRVLGATTAWAADDLAGRGVLVDARRLAAALGTADQRDVLLVTGDGAAAAVQDLSGVRLERTEVLAELRAQSLPASVSVAVGWAGGAAALLALIAFGATLRLGARERAEERILLAVLGAPIGTSRRLLLLRTGPPTLLAVLGGAVAGVLASAVLAPVFGLRPLASLASVAPASSIALGSTILVVLLAALVEPDGGSRNRAILIGGRP